MASISYKTVNSFESRKKESSLVLTKYPDKIPAICEVDKSSSNSIKLHNNKWLIPKDLTIGQFLIKVREKIKIGAEHSIFLFDVKGALFSTSQLISAVYHENKDDDGFVYFIVSKQEVFG